MRTRNILIALFAAAACLLLAVCQAKNDEETTEDFTSLAELAAGDAADSDFLGLWTAIDGDIAVLGAPSADVNGTNDGAAYVYDRGQGGTNAWGQIKKLVGGDGATSDHFGFAVDISGDIIAVGAYGEDGSGTDIGAVYVFYRDQGGTDAWGQVKKFKAGDATASAGAGYDVAVAGDYAIVGAPFAGGGGTEKGQAYILARDEGGTDNWGQLQRLRESGADDYGFFGYSVAFGGVDALVGAPGVDGDGTDRGAAFIFEKN